MCEFVNVILVDERHRAHRLGPYPIGAKQSAPDGMVLDIVLSRNILQCDVIHWKFFRY